MRIGFGYDVHKLVKDKDLILGGVKIPYKYGLLGHSDADVIVHAIMDALLGAAGLEDIGKHFPNSDPAFKGVSSFELLEKVMVLLEEKNYKVNNIDGTIVAQKPKLAPYILEMRENISKVLKTPLDNINLKATTTEGLGYQGAGQGISSYAVCTIKEKTQE